MAAPAPSPAARPYRGLRIIVAVLFLLLVAATVVTGMYYWRWATRAARAGDRAPVRVTVAPSASLQSVGRELEGKGLIRSWRVFSYLGRESRVKPGVYEIAAGETPQGILNRLASGDVATTKVTFPEGFTLRRMAARLKDRGLIADEAAFLRLVTERGKTFRASFPLPDNLEGYLFPDTYRFPVGADDAAIAQRMLENFEKRVAEGLGGEIKRSGRSLAEVVNVAAMVEREAETAEDRPRVAGVIYNRLAKGMRLQIDATVQYARILAGGNHENRVLYRHLEVESPYNTYKVAGLPPGPICNPGLESLAAAARPEKHPYLFYVQAAGSRGHVFARTYAEHQRNVAQARRAARALR